MRRLAIVLAVFVGIALFAVPARAANWQCQAVPPGGWRCWAAGGQWSPPPAPPSQPAAPPAPAPPVCSCAGDTLNCSDFATHAQAQACFDYCVAQGRGDVHRLDADHDGLACESLP